MIRRCQQRRGQGPRKMGQPRQGHCKKEQGLRKRERRKKEQVLRKRQQELRRSLLVAHKGHRSHLEGRHRQRHWTQLNQQAHRHFRLQEEGWQV